MPEIWIPYGAVEVAVDIRAENLLELIDRPKVILTDDEIRQRIADLRFSGRVGIFIADDQEPCLRVAKAIATLLTETNFSEHDVQFIVSKKSGNLVRKNLEGIPFKVATASTDGKSTFNVYANANTKILLSQLGFDGLFGFSGGFVSMFRALESRLVGDAFLAHPVQKPTPGITTDAYAMLIESIGNFTDVQSVAVVPSQDDVGEIVVGDMQSSVKAAQDKMLSLCTRNVSERVRGLIVSPGNKRAGATLSSSVRSLWNIFGAIREKGTITLLAECIEGLGADAFKLYGTGRIDPAEISRMNKYVEGLEDLIFLTEASQRYELLLVSSLPNYYVETKFNLRSRRKASDAFSNILSSHGKRTRVIIVPQASDTLLRA